MIILYSDRHFRQDNQGRKEKQRKTGYVTKTSVDEKGHAVLLSKGTESSKETAAATGNSGYMS